MGHYGCHNREPFRPRLMVQDGWYPAQDGLSRMPIMKSIPDPMSRECKYDLAPTDAGCTGCKHATRKPE